MRISAGTIANTLLVPACLVAEEAAIRQSELASSPYHHLDATPTRANRVEQQCPVLGASLFLIALTVMLTWP